ncbi:MAG: addiction module protein [Kiritimatiellia bacterium]
MHLTIPLDKMTATDKLQAIEAIWANLSLASEDVPSPAWQADEMLAGLAVAVI